MRLPSGNEWGRGTFPVPPAGGADRIKAVAAAKGVQFLDLRDRLQGREVCAKASGPVSSPAPARTSEWARWIDSSEKQGLVQESMHPNDFGQPAAGRCPALVLARPADTGFGCRNTAGADESGMYLTPAAQVPQAAQVP